jgi:alpha-tubulin suppressor-like RCC1 family protein
MNITCWNHTVVVCDDNTLRVSGQNNYGQLGLGHTRDQKTHQILNLHLGENVGIKHVACGNYHTVVVCDDNTLRVFGNNDFGQLGLGHIPNQYTPQTLDLHLGENVGIKHVACGNFNTVVVCDDNTLRVFGNNISGKLGLGDIPNLNIPQTPDLHLGENVGINSIACGGNHTVVVCDDNTLRVFGQNRFGQLGLGHIRDQNTPQTLNLPLGENVGIKHVACGYSHTVVVCDDNTLRVFGHNVSGQLGLGHIRDQNTPHLLDLHLGGNVGVNSIACGSLHTVVVCDDNTLRVFGQNGFGQLGLGDIPYQYTPQLLDLHLGGNVGINSIACGNNHTVVVCDDNTLCVFGDNRDGELGLGDIPNQNTPRLLDLDLGENVGIKLMGLLTKAARGGSLRQLYEYKIKKYKFKLSHLYN